MKSIKGIICSKLSECYDNFFQLYMYLDFWISFNTRVFTSMFTFSLKIKLQTKMRGLRKMLTLSTVNQVESKNIIQILLFYLFSIASMELLCFFVSYHWHFKSFVLLSGHRNTRNLFPSGTKLLCKIKNFKRIAGGLVHLSAMPTEVGRKFAEANLKQLRILSMNILHNEIMGLQGMLFWIWGEKWH